MPVRLLQLQSPGASLWSKVFRGSSVTIPALVADCQVKVSGRRRRRGAWEDSYKGVDQGRKRGGYGTSWKGQLGGRGAGVRMRMAWTLFSALIMDRHVMVSGRPEGYGSLRGEMGEGAGYTLVGVATVLWEGVQWGGGQMWRRFI